MYFQYKGLNINYNINGDGDFLLLLHGWGVHSNTFVEVVAGIKDHYKVITMDFCGFGMSDEPIDPLSLEDYVDHVRALLSFLKIEYPIILGHSFGGRVAIRYSTMYNVKKLILVDSAGIKHFNFKTFFKVYKYKILKHLYRIFSKSKLKRLINSSGSNDYKNATSVMKKTMSNIIKINLEKDLKKIFVETLILWGYNDKITPFSDAKTLEKMIEKSRLITFFNSGHYPYIDEKRKFINILIGGLNV